MSAPRYDLVFEEHAAFTFAFQWVLDDGPPEVYQDLTGWTAKLQVREKRDEASAVLSERKTVDDTIVLGGVAGTVYATWSAAEVDALSAGVTNDAYYDLLLYDAAGAPTRTFEGRVHVKPGVTT